MLRKEKTDKKYADFIRECASRGSFPIKSMLAKYRVDPAIITTMRQEECVTSLTSDVCNWIETKPNEVMISRIIDSHRNRVINYRLARKNKIKSEAAPTDTYKFKLVEPEVMTEQSAVAFLKSLGGYEIFKIERKQL